MYMTGSNKVVPVLGPQCSTDAAIRYGDMVKLDTYDKVTFFVECGCFSTLKSSALCCTGNAIAGIYSGYDASGGGLAAIGVYSTIGSTSADTCKIEGAAAAVYCMSSLSTAANTLVINGITYTFTTSTAVHTTGTFTADRRVMLQQTPTATGIEDTYHHLAAFINHPIYGVTGVNAQVFNAAWKIHSSSSGHVYMWCDGPVTLTIQATSSEVLKPVKYLAALETYGAEVANLNSSHKYVTVGITPATQWTISAVAVKHTPRYSPESSRGSYYAYADGVNHTT